LFLGNFLWHWGPALAAMVGIFFASSLPDPGPIPGDMSDKSAHFLAYGLLGVLVLRAVARARLRGVTRRSALVAWLVSVAYGASDEFHQWFVPGRTAAADDWVADAVGAAVSIGLMMVVAGALRGRAARYNEQL
jgi:VanZ family protein